MKIFPVSVSKVIGLIKLQAFSVIRTCTSAPVLTRRLARDAILYAAIPPQTPRRTVLSLNMIFSLRFHK